MEEQKIKTHSYHTFIFPFLWNEGGIARERFDKTLNQHWEKVTEIAADEASFVASYNQYRYFNAAARNAVYSTGSETDAVWNYAYRLEDAAFYEIEKEGRVLYSLPVKGIRLKLFASGIGVMVFELENNTHADICEVNKINELGRQIYRAFVENPEGDCFACPDAIYVRYSGGTKICGGGMKKKPDTVDEMDLAGTVLDLLSNEEHSVTANKKSADGKKLFYIEPVLDERMFVACYHINPAFVAECIKWENGGYRYEQDVFNKELKAADNVSATLYKTFYVDGGSVTCQNKQMMAEFIDKALYKRWIEEGSITGITDYSMVTVTNTDWDVLIRNFLTEYVEMLILVLAQRASLRNYENMISHSVLKHGDINRIHESYIAFQSQLLLNEVTSLQQGMELYSLMRKNLLVAEQVAEVNEHIEALFKQQSSGNESRENFILFIIAVLAMLDPLNTVFTWFTETPIPWLKPAVFAACALVATGLYLYKRK